MQAHPQDPDNFPFMTLGNKIDADGGNSRVVSKKKAEAWAQSKGGMPYFETSAKDDINVEAAFTQMARNALRHEKEEDLFVPEAVDMNTSAGAARKRSGCC
ncbi:hypothetical protein DUNSADRAFT_13735 [Dunaliella salina]|uniref:Uncharacterized protein n=1 Tax=Dunaliella salina TaxID=3046 RepID=A0ABQ7H381_DUNSA|nr:hypothetical protein DUNSADRAFT_13735 [Dunaliella salina]|eukprot:KAF5841281.1 hypothetical protein DUNSADRAFT_13735 [Dunaliella salina]